VVVVVGAPLSAVIRSLCHPGPGVGGQGKVKGGESTRRVWRRWIFIQVKIDKILWSWNTSKEGRASGFQFFQFISVYLHLHRVRCFARAKSFDNGDVDGVKATVLNGSKMFKRFIRPNRG